MHASALNQIASRAVRHAESGEFVPARNAWLEALRLAPGSAEIMLELSYLESLADEYRAAREWTLRAARAGPGSLECALSLVRRLRTFNEARVLDAFARAMLAGSRGHVRLLVECAIQLSNLNLPDMALACAQAAAAVAPEDVQARLARGQLLANHGRVAEADADFDWILAREPANLQALWLACRLHRQTPACNRAGPLQRALATRGDDARQAAVGWRALHKVRDELGEYEAAWSALESMCNARRATEAHDPMESRRLVDALIAQEWDGVLPGASNAGRQSIPIFIVGMYRSGTTLLEQLLAGNRGVAALGELGDFPAALRLATNHHIRGALDLPAIQRSAPEARVEAGQRYLEAVDWRVGNHLAFTDKLPANLFNVGYICQAIPRARILHMVRDPLDTCFSNLRELFTEVNRYSYDQQALADHYLQAERLMAHWHAVFPGRILEVSYDRLTRDTEAVMGEVAAFCGVDYVDAMKSTRSSMRAVATASSVQVRAPVEPAGRPKWLPYLEHLGPLIEALSAGGAPIPPAARPA